MEYLSLRKYRVAELTGISESTITKLEKQGDFPKSFSVGKSRFYRWEDIEHFIDFRARKAGNCTFFYTAERYQMEAARTINRSLSTQDQVRHAVLGMASEAGEIAGLFQKRYQGHGIDEEHLKREIGDLLWFVAEMCTAHEWKLSDVMKTNVDKLRARFPDGFDADRDAHRAKGDV